MLTWGIYVYKARTRLTLVASGVHISFTAGANMREMVCYDIVTRFANRTVYTAALRMPEQIIVTRWLRLPTLWSPVCSRLRDRPIGRSPECIECAFDLDCVRLQPRVHLHNTFTTP